MKTFLIVALVIFAAGVVGYIIYLIDKNKTTLTTAPSDESSNGIEYILTFYD